MPTMRQQSKNPVKTASSSRFLSFALTLQTDQYLPASMPFLHIPESLTGLTQLVTLVDNWSHLSGRHELAHRGQILFIHPRNEKDHLLSPEP
jgi:hypothetical protein